VGSTQGPKFGNILLGIWVSERTLELYGRSGKTDMVPKQRKKVEVLRDALASLQGSKFFGSLTMI